MFLKRGLRRIFAYIAGFLLWLAGVLQGAGPACTENTRQRRIIKSSAKCVLLCMQNSVPRKEWKLTVFFF